MRVRPLFVAGMAFVVACKPAPATTSVLPPPSIPAASSAPANPPPPKPVESAIVAIANAEPPPPPSIKELLAHPPPAPVMPARTCPKLPPISNKVAVPGKESAVIVTVMDYLSLAPIADVRVNLFHGSVCFGEKGCKPSHPHPDEQLKMTGKTDAEGKIIFQVPDLDYAVVIPDEPVPGHLPFSSDYNLGTQKCHELQHEWRSINGRALLSNSYFIPETMLAVRTKEDAIASAFQIPELIAWLRNHQDEQMIVRGGGSSWDVGFGTERNFKRMALVNVFNGSAVMLGRGD